MTNPQSPRPTGRGGGRGPRRQPPRPVEVVSVERLTPRMLSVIFGGESLRGFPEPAPTAHIKLFVPDADGRLVLPTAGPEGLVWPEGRPPMRTYTPRRHDPETATLEVQFVLHGDGQAAQWAARAKPGDRAAIGGPGGRFTIPADAKDWWLGGDESALPAIATFIEALPSDSTAQVDLEVSGSEDRIELPEHPGVDVVWHTRRRADGWGEELELAVRAADLADVHVWVACEAQAVRRIRKRLLTDHALPASRVTTRGYWRVGEANHPDHDFGED